MSVSPTFQVVWGHPDGRIIDGRNRFVACQMAGIEPEFVPYSGVSPLAFVLSKNLHRRHLDSSQRAAIAVEMLPVLEDEAKERQRLSEGRGQKGSQFFDYLNSNNGKATQQAAEMFHTNRQYVSEAKSLKEQAPDLFEQVKSGEATIVQARREFQKRTRPEPSPLTGKYRVIYADPPLDYSNSELWGSVKV